MKVKVRLVCPYCGPLRWEVAEVPEETIKQLIEALPKVRFRSAGLIQTLADLIEIQL